MKLIRKGQPGEESPGLLLSDGREVDASSFGEDYDEVFFETDGLERGRIRKLNFVSKSIVMCFARDGRWKKQRERGSNSNFFLEIAFLKPSKSFLRLKISIINCAHLIIFSNCWKGNCRFNKF